jgi:hypothetical protein
VLLYSLLRKGEAAGNLNFFPDKVRDFKFDSLTPVFVLGIGVQNTSNQSFTIRALAGNCYSDGYYIGNLSNFIPQTIPPRSQVVINVNLRLALIGVVNQLIDAFQNRNFRREITLDGHANVDYQVVPIKQTLAIGL